MHARLAFYFTHFLLCPFYLLTWLTFLDECGQNWNSSVGVLDGGNFACVVYHDVQLARTSMKERTGLNTDDR